MRALLKSDPLTVTLEGRTYPVKLRRNARARKMILRVDALNAEIKLTAPPYVSMKELQKFVSENTLWLETEHSRVADISPLASGDFIPYLGEQHQVFYTNRSPRKVELSDKKLRVGGPADQAPARLERWFRAEAKSILGDDAAVFAEMLDTSFERVSIGDMKSRWGSCSSSGTLRFNWRLILAPVEVRRYVAAHEVSHLLEMNHSDAFWRHVERAVPDYRQLRKWLRAHGADLMKLRFKNHQTVD